MPNVLKVSSFAIIPEWDVSDMLDGVSCIIPVSTYLGQSRFLNSWNQSSWGVMWLDALESTNHTLSKEVLVALVPTSSVLYDSLGTFLHGRHNRNLWHSSWVVDWSKLTLVSSFGSPLNNGQVSNNTCIRLGCFGGLVRQDGSPFWRTSLLCSWPLADYGNCVLRSTDYVGRFLFPWPIGNRASDHRANSSFVGRDFLRPTVLTKGQWPIWSCWIVVLTRSGIFAPFLLGLLPATTRRFSWRFSSICRNPSEASKPAMCNVAHPHVVFVSCR